MKPGPSPSFLDRQRWGLSHWLIIAMAALFCLGFVPRGVRKAIESNVNKAEDWLPKNYPESTDLRWFADHFIGAKFVLVSWDGCLLRDEAQIQRVVDRLNEEVDADGEPIFTHFLTGPGQIASLTQAPSNLSRGAAVERLEGALVGPPTLDLASLPEPTTAAEADANRTRVEQSRSTCLVAYLSLHVTDSNKQMRRAIGRVSDIVQEEVGVTAEQVHLGGPPVDNVTIDIEGEKTLLRLAGFSGIVGLALSFWCFRSLRLTWFVFSVAGISAGVSLAIVYWYGVFEVTALGFDKKHLGTVDAILMSMPAVVYVLGLSGAIHIVNYYRDERDDRGLHGAVERGVRIGWGPCALAALTTAVGLGSLGASQIIPIKKFGVFSAAGVLATVAVLLAILPVCLHLFPPKLPGDREKDAKRRRRKGGHKSPLPGWAHVYSRMVTNNHALVTVACLGAMAWFAVGLTKTDSQVRLLKLLDPGTKLIQDYGWFEQHLGNLVPMEVVITLADDQLRSPRERGDDGPRYRMTMYERLRLIERLQARIETLEPVSRAMSAATFGPADRQTGMTTERIATDFTISEALEESRGALSEYLAVEKPAEDAPADAGRRELWRISARVAALTDVDYGHFVVDLQGQVEPVLDVYRLRDQLLTQLQSQSKPLVGSRIVVAFDAAADLKAPPAGGDDALLVDLLRESRVKMRGGKLWAVNVSQLDGERADAYRKVLTGADAVVTLSEVAASQVRKAAGEEATLVTLAARGADTAPARCEANEALLADSSLAAVYTGVVPLVYKTQRELLTSLKESMGWATVLIAVVMVAVLRSPGGGLVSMIPNVFPIVAVFGSLGWLGIKIDIGIMMTASVALGVAVDDTIHFLTWFRRGIVQGLDRRSATLLAFDRCAVAMTQTTLIAGMGLAVFATSTFTPTQQFGCLMITMLGAALVGDLLMLPALLCGPLGRFFAPGAPARPVEDEGPTEALAPTGIGGSDDPQPEPSPAAPAEDLPSDELPKPHPAVETNGIPSNGAAARAPEPEPASDPTHPAVPEPLTPSNAALVAKLQKLRRQ